MPVLGLYERHVLKKTRLDGANADPLPIRVAERIEKCEYVRIGVAFQDLMQDTLSTADDVEPIMNDCHSHADLLLHCNKQ